MANETAARHEMEARRPIRRQRSARAGGVIALFLVGCVALLWGCGGADAEASRAVDALLANGRNGATPGAAVMVIRDGRVLKKAGYGMADLARGVPVESDTTFRLASVSKQFTAMAVMMLQEEGRLAYDDPATRFLPEIRARFGDGITIRHLLTHTSGLPDYYDSMTELTGVERPLTKHALAVYAKWGEPLFAPGDRYEYSNPGYELLALIVERASGEKFSAFVESHIFTPLGMKSSVIMDERSPRVGKRALGYRRNGDGFELYDDDPLNYLIGSGGVYSTLEDLYRWDQALYGETLVRAETLAQAFSPSRHNGGAAYPYGFGWRLNDHLGRRCVAHAGGWVGFSTFIGRYVDDRFSVIVLTNLEEGEAEELADAIAGIYLGGGAPPLEDPV